jgi:formyl-CoA transferase
MDVVRTAEADPALPAAAMGDHPSAMTMFAGVMTALYRRERTGLGTKVSTSLMANGLWAASAMLAGVLAGTAPFQRSSRVAPRNALLNQYRTADDRWLSIIVLQEDKNWPAFAAAIERPDLMEDPRFADKAGRHANAQALAGILDEVFRTYTYAEWSPRLLAQGVTFSLVATMEEVIDDPQAQLNDMLVEVEGHSHGRRQAINSPFWLRDAPKVPARLGPELGAQGPEILGEAGYDERHIEQLLARGVLAR